MVCRVSRKVRGADGPVRRRVGPAGPPASCGAGACGPPPGGGAPPEPWGSSEPGPETGGVPGAGDAPGTGGVPGAVGGAGGLGGLRGRGGFGGGRGGVGRVREPHHECVDVRRLVVAAPDADRDEAEALVEPLGGRVVDPHLQQHLPALEVGRGPQQRAQQAGAEAGAAVSGQDADGLDVAGAGDRGEPAVAREPPVGGLGHEVAPGGEGPPGVCQLGPEHAGRPGVLGEEFVLQGEHRVDVPPAHLAQQDPGAVRRGRCLRAHRGVTTL